MQTTSANAWRDIAALQSKIVGVRLAASILVLCWCVCCSHVHAPHQQVDGCKDEVQQEANAKLLQIMNTDIMYDQAQGLRHNKTAVLSPR
jgi:hypothetical protein